MEVVDDGSSDLMVKVVVVAVVAVVVNNSGCKAVVHRTMLFCCLVSELGHQRELHFLRFFRIII